MDLLPQCNKLRLSAARSADCGTAWDADKVQVIINRSEMVLLFISQCFRVKLQSVQLNTEEVLVNRGH